MMVPLYTIANIWYGERMKVCVTINERGAITIPAAMRQAFGLEAGEELILEQVDQGILLRPSVELYTDQRIAEFVSDENEINKLLSDIE